MQYFKRIEEIQPEICVADNIISRHRLLRIPHPQLSIHSLRIPGKLSCWVFRSLRKAKSEAKVALPSLLAGLPAWGLDELQVHDRSIPIHTLTTGIFFLSKNTQMVFHKRSKISQRSKSRNSSPVIVENRLIIVQ